MGVCGRFIAAHGSSPKGPLNDSDRRSVVAMRNEPRCPAHKSLREIADPQRLGMAPACWRGMACDKAPATQAEGFSPLGNCDSDLVLRMESCIGKTKGAVV